MVICLQALLGKTGWGDEVWIPNQKHCGVKNVSSKMDGGSTTSMVRLSEN